MDRFEYRHNSILAHFAKKISDNKKAGMTVYADLQGWRINRYDSSESGPN